jgi:MOSC domain-containing protein YiiM
MMKILSIQVGLPRSVTYGGKVITTGIFKDPINGPVKLRTLNIEGDGQADLKVHGGRDKALYAYSFDAYPWWQTNRPQDSYEYGAFGENLTIDQLPENSTHLGDTFELGTAVIQVTEPRFPCFKLGIKFKDPTILKTFMKSKRSGIYFRVLKEGTIATGDSLRLVGKEQTSVSVQEIFLMDPNKIEKERVREILSIKSLGDRWRKKFEDLLIT